MLRSAAAFADEHREMRSRSTFGDAMDAFVASRAALLSPSTMRGYESLSKMLHIRHTALCNTDIYAVSSADVQKVVADLSAGGRSTKTIKNYLGLISDVLASACVQMPRVTIPQQIVEDEYFPDNGTVRKLCDAAAGNPDLLIPIELAAFAMMRRSEICALQWPDDFAGNTAHIYKALVRGAHGYHIKAPKTKSSRRFVPVPSFVMEDIRSAGKVTSYVPNTITQRFEELLDREGIPRFRFHQLRAYSASAALDAGCSVQVVETLGGWEHGSAVLQKAYVHTLEHAKQQQVPVLDRYFLGVAREDFREDSSSN